MKTIPILFLSMMFTLSAWGFDVPRLQGPVMDQANLFGPREERAMEGMIRNLFSRSLAQVQVLTVKDLQGLSIEEASIKITDQWKLGTKDKDNGILILVALKERKVRIEVGQGLEGVIPDAVASRIIQDTVLPLFRQGAPGTAILSAVTVIQGFIYTDAGIKDEEASAGPSNFGAEVQTLRAKAEKFFAILFFIIIILANVFGRGRRGRFLRGVGYGTAAGWGAGRGGFGGGFGGGGGWSGGGGGFSGGGASGGW
ncbi:MAG: TPM domain-containing protein [Pseudobdellovibrionaceae bacterium]